MKAQDEEAVVLVVIIIDVVVVVVIVAIINSRGKRDMYREFRYVGQQKSERWRKLPSASAAAGCLLESDR